MELLPECNQAYPVGTQSKKHTALYVKDENKCTKCIKKGSWKYNSLFKNELNSQVFAAYQILGKWYQNKHNKVISA